MVEGEFVYKGEVLLKQSGLVNYPGENVRQFYLRSEFLRLFSMFTVIVTLTGQQYLICFISRLV
jgi:ribosomal protein L27